MADLSITAGSVVPSSSATKVNGKAGEAINAGQTVFLDTTASNTYKLADGNDSTKMPVAGIAGNTAGTGQALQVITADPALTIGSHGLGNGIPLFQSATAGGICPFADLSTGNKTTCVAVTATNTTVWFGLVGGTGTKA
jgi:hypothetical protein